MANKTPAEWVVVTRDLFADFGERIIEGIALTAFNGKAAYFDHIYFGRSIEDLDRIDATGALTDKPMALGNEDLARLWSEVGGTSAPKAYGAFWQLRASPTEAIPFLRKKLAVADGGPGAEQIRKWIRELDADRFVIRNEATKKLTEHLDSAALHLEETLRGTPPPELRQRIEKLLELHKSDSTTELILKAVRILEYTEKPEARKCLEDLAKGTSGTRATIAAKAALKRLTERQAP